MIFRFFKIVLLPVLLIALLGCTGLNSKNDTEIPNRFLWVWERPEDVSFLKGTDIGVAYLAQTIAVKEGELIQKQRLQPLVIPEDTYVIGVTRIETIRSPNSSPQLSRGQKNGLVKYIVESSRLPRVRSIQIDFDARESERDFYAELIDSLVRELPEGYPLTITALASWCLGDKWLKDVRVAEAVPMVFDMGADSDAVLNHLRNGLDWKEKKCKFSYGFSVDQDFRLPVRSNRKLFYFSARPWKASDLRYIRSTK